MLVAAAALVGVSAALAVARATRDEDESPPVLVDERRGVLRGVELGASADDVRARLGEPTDRRQGFFPAGSRYTGPPGIPTPASDHRAPAPLHYEETAYLVSPTRGVYSMATLRRGARTRAGVGVGDDLEIVRERYGRVECRESPAGEAIFGGETPTYPWCRAIVGDVRVFFGGDPIESITLTRLGR